VTRANAFLACACLVTATSSAHAQADTEAPDATDAGEYVSLDEELLRATGDGPYRTAISAALEAFNAKRWADAQTMFQRAHQLQPSARTLRGMGLSGFYSADYVTAARAFGEAVQHEDKPLTAAQREQVLALLDQAMARIGRVRVALTPADAQLSVDDAAVDMTSGNLLLLTAGEHALSATREGHGPLTRSVWIAPGDNLEVELSLEPETPVQPAPAPQPEPTSEPATANVATTAAAPPADEERQRIWTWVAAGAAVGLGVTGAVLWNQGLGIVDELEATCRTSGCDDAERRRRIEQSSVGEYETTANLAFGAAGAAAVTAVILFFVEDTDDGQDAENQAALRVGPASVALFVQY